MSDPRFLQDGFDKRLSHVIEECGEVIERIGGLLAAAGKTQRWGPHSVNPLLPREQQESNLDWLRREIANVGPEAIDMSDALRRLSDAIAQEYGGP